MWSRLHQYARVQLWGDVVAGLTVAIVAIPQGMAYALIAGVEPKYGLYAAIVPTIVAAACGSGGALITGPTNATSLVVFSIIAPLLAGPTLASDRMAVVFLISLMCGATLLMIGLLRLGGIVRYVSRAVLTGFTAGAGVLIICWQIDKALGVQPAHEGLGWPLPIVVQRIVGLVRAGGGVSAASLAIAAGTIALVLLLRRIDRRIPAELICLVLAALIVAVGHAERLGVALIGQIPRTLPPVSAPQFDWQSVRSFGGGAVALALLGMVQSVAIGKALAAKTGRRFGVNRELCAQGLANVAAAWTSGIPVAGSFVRSVLNSRAGARTRLAGAFSGLFVAATMLVLAGWARYVPLAALAGIIVCAAMDLIDLPEIRRLLGATRTDAAVLVITAAATLSVKLEYAIYLGVVLSAVLVLRQASSLHMVEMVWVGGGRFREQPVDQQTGSFPAVLLQIEGTLFFGVADELEARLRQIGSRGAKVIILRMKRAHDLDVTVADRLKQLADEFRSRGVALLLCGLRPEMRDLFDRTGLEEAIGSENLFVTDRDIFGSVQRAAARARQIVGQDFVGPVFRSDSQDEQAWSYVI